MEPATAEGEVAPEVHHGRDRYGLVSTVRVAGGVAATPMHAHASMILGRVDEGTRTLELADGRLDLGTGDGFLVPPDVAHAWRAGPGGTHRVIAIDVAGMALPRWPAAAIRDPLWGDLFDRLFDATCGDILPLVVRLLDETGRLVPLRRDDRVVARPVRLARTMAADRLDEALDLAELGRRTGASPFHLHRLYRKTWGLTPAEHRLEARLRSARRLILDGVPLAEVAAALGFADQSHLSRAFRRLMGVPPGLWARQMRGR